MTVKVDDKNWFSWEGVATIRADCEQEALKEGLSGLQLFMRTQELFSDALNARPTYKERQAEWLSKQRPAKADPLVEALQAIADGHNDPRSLARSVLEGRDQ